ncbi:hypothetical protein GF345_04585 [Candidatus Woesearchaeota archaeon]|nr:hypothetical protein [Candidatus Woesearchaeota archaeon]
MRCLMLVAVSIIMLAAVTGANAQNMESYNLSVSIAYNNAVVKERMRFDNPVSGNIILEIPENHEGLSVNTGSDSPEYTVEGGILNIMLSSAEVLELSYVSSDLLERTDFIASFEAPYNISSFMLKVTLPENAVLVKPISESNLGSGSVYPKPDSAETDGRSITLKWHFKDMRKGDQASFLVRYRKQAEHIYSFLIIISLVMIIALLAVYIILRKPKIKEVENITEKHDDKPEETADKPENEKPSFEKHLKEDEEQIVNILKQRESKCEQGTLRVITGFSKAKLSGLLKELEDRKIVHKEKRGKKNLVFLREQ